nr:MAG TPA: hypothetical protein [Caudoviricetes sp.]
MYRQKIKKNGGNLIRKSYAHKWNRTTTLHLTRSVCFI